nr:MAG: hypothetical protein [uncultured cyanophage]
MVFYQARLRKQMVSDIEKIATERRVRLVAEEIKEELKICFKRTGFHVVVIPCDEKINIMWENDYSEKSVLDFFRDRYKKIGITVVVTRLYSSQAIMNAIKEWKRDNPECRRIEIAFDETLSPPNSDMKILLSIMVSKKALKYFDTEDDLDQSVYKLFWLLQEKELFNIKDKRMIMGREARGFGGRA